MLNFDQGNLLNFQSSFNFFNYEYKPGVSVYKWFEPGHQVNITNRWAINKTDDLQSAFFNGIGYNSWENVWSVWNQISDRYAETIRRISAVYRSFPDIWASKDWEPYIPVLQKGVFASKFPDRDKTVYSFINRDSTDVNGAQITLPYHNTEKYYDLSEERFYLQRMRRAGDRYAAFCKRYSETIDRIPATYIASYLGITLETLIRIKKKQ